MKRGQAEKKLLKLFAEMVAVYHKYNPDGTYLDVSFLNGHLSIHNRFYDVDAGHPIDAWLEMEHIDLSYVPLYASEFEQKLTRKERKEFVALLKGADHA